MSPVITPEPPSPEARPIRYLALGDSYTIGESVSKEESFPYQLSAKIKEGKKLYVTETKVIARTGWTTQNLINALDAEKIKDSFQLVTLLIGVNNQYQFRDTGEYAIQFETLLQRSILYAGGNHELVIVISIPDYGYTPFGTNNRENISADIDRFNAINQRITLHYGITYVNITPISRSDDPALVASDGLHPSAEQYRRWTALISEAIFPDR